MTEIIATTVAAVIIIAHNEWRYRQLHDTIDVVGTMVGELCDMSIEQKLRK